MRVSRGNQKTCPFSEAQITRTSAMVLLLHTVYMQIYLQNINGRTLASGIACTVPQWVYDNSWKNGETLGKLFLMISLQFLPSVISCQILMVFDWSSENLGAHPSTDFYTSSFWCAPGVQCLTHGDTSLFKQQMSTLKRRGCLILVMRCSHGLYSLDPMKCPPVNDPISAHTIFILLTGILD